MNRNYLKTNEYDQTIAPRSLRLIIRVLSTEDDEFVKANGLDLAEFREVRRDLFRKLLRGTKIYFKSIQEKRRVHMRLSGRVDMGALLIDDIAFTRALLELRVALAAHRLRVALASAIVRRACRKLEASFATLDASVRRPESRQPV